MPLRRALTPLNDSDETVVDDHQVNRILIVTQVVFFSSVALCLLINHGEMAENDGISFYGVYHSTIEILVVGYVVAALGLWRIANYFKLSRVSPFTVLATRLVGIGLVALLLTPYNKGAFFNWSHMIVGVFGALLQLEITLQLLRRFPSIPGITALIVQLVGGIICAASLPDWQFRYLLPGEIVFQIGFAGSLFVGIRGLSAEH
jgi:hypothetical protein